METIVQRINPSIIHSIDIIHCKNMLTSNNDEYKISKQHHPLQPFKML